MTVVLPSNDFVTSTLSGALTNNATSGTIGTGLGLPAANGVLQVDYDSAIAVGVDYGPETITYTAYNTGTGALTGITRGVAGTTGVAHNNGATVQAGISGKMLDAIVRDGTAFSAGAIPITAISGGTNWADYTPVWTGGTPTLSNGTIVGRWRQVGKTVTAEVILTWGSSTSVSGTNPWSITLPVAAAQSAVDRQTVGPCWIFDSGTAYFVGIAMLNDVNNAYFFSNASSGGVSKTSPMTWAVGNKLVFQITYEAA